VALLADRDDHDARGVEIKAMHNARLGLILL
jgi:hypothetical protein